MSPCVYDLIKQYDLEESSKAVTPMTTVQFEISDQRTAVLKAEAMKRGVSAEQYLRQMVDHKLGEEPPPRPAPIPIFLK